MSTKHVILCSGFCWNFNVCSRKAIIKAAKGIINSDKMCRSYSDLNYGITFLEHSVYPIICHWHYTHVLNVVINNRQQVSLDATLSKCLPLPLYSIQTFVRIWPLTLKTFQQFPLTWRIFVASFTEISPLSRYITDGQTDGRMYWQWTNGEPDGQPDNRILLQLTVGSGCIT